MPSDDCGWMCHNSLQTGASVKTRSARYRTAGCGRRARTGSTAARLSLAAALLLSARARAVELKGKVTVGSRDGENVAILLHTTNTAKGTTAGSAAAAAPVADKRLDEAWL